MTPKYKSLYCVKTPYATEETARLFCVHARRDNKPRKGPMKKPYLCPRCSTANSEVWHLEVTK